MLSTYDRTEGVRGLGSLINRFPNKKNLSVRTTIAAYQSPVSERWVNRLCKGDVLVTGRGSGGLVGHAAIMATDYWVLEMPGGEGWQHGIEDNNRRISKHDWLELHETDRTTLYRNVNTAVAHAAADWAYRTYYNPNLGSEKTKHVTYRLTNDIWGMDPSYCSKLVIQAYHFGTGDRNVIRDLSALDHFIVPTTIPTYFLDPYALVNVGLYSLAEKFVNFITTYNR